MTNTTLYDVYDYEVKKLCDLKILMVEDNLLNTKLVSILFSQNGMHVEIAENGAEAIKKIQANKYDIVLMDIEMPVMNGYQAAKLIREQLKNNVPIIAMTAHAIPGEREKCLQAGMNEHIPKPFDAEHLFSVIYNLTCNKMFVGTKKTEQKSENTKVLSEKVCNLRYLFDATSGNKKIVKDIIDIFLEETPGELSALQLAIKNTDYSLISDIAHKIKSSFSLLGIAVLEPVFAEMEQLGNNASGIEKIVLLNLRVNIIFNLAKEEMKLHNTGL